MLKLFIGTLSSLLLLVAGIVIFYWRDIQYDPTGADLLNYLLLFPLILCVILWSPVFIYHAIKAHQKRKEQQKQAQVEQHQSMLHVWNEEQSSGVVQDYLSSLGVITQQIHLEHHYFSQETAYKDWMLLLEQISQQSEEITFILNVDSEIDQELLDEKTWLTDHYLPAEYASSWCLASSSLPLLDIKPLKQLKIALNEANLANHFASPAMKQLEQFKDIQPFVLMLDDITDIQTMKKLNQIFDRSGIESHHFIHTKQSFGHTQHLAKVFGFMLSMHLPDELMAMIYSTDQLSTHCFLHACEDSNISVEPAI